MHNGVDRVRHRHHATGVRCAPQTFWCTRGVYRYGAGHHLLFHGAGCTDLLWYAFRPFWPPSDPPGWIPTLHYWRVCGRIRANPRADVDGQIYCRDGRVCSAHDDHRWCPRPVRRRRDGPHHVVGLHHIPVHTGGRAVLRVGHISGSIVAGCVPYATDFCIGCFPVVALAINLAVEPNSSALALEPMGSMAGMAASVYGTCFFFIGSALGSIVSYFMAYGVYPLVLGFFVIGLIAVVLVFGDTRPSSK